MDNSYIMQKIDQIMENLKYLEVAVEQLENLDEAGVAAASNKIEK